MGVKKVMVLTTAVLTFIPFWKAAAVVLCDFGSSAFYAGSIAMRAFGEAFPWYIIAVMMLSGVLLALYIESCALFVRGGIYRVVREGLGHRAAKVAVSALLFDFLLTGPISSVSAGHYLAGLINSISAYFNLGFHVPANTLAVVFAILVTVYFWRQNIKGLSESADKSAKIVFFTLAVCGIMVLWAAVTLIQRGGAALPPFELEFTDKSLGWSQNFSFMKAIGMMGVMMALGHSILALSGVETLAQVFREIEYPKIKNLKKAALTVFLFALLFTGGLTFLASLIIPHELITTKYSDNLLAGIAMELNGPSLLKLIMQSLVVFAGVLMLSGAVNTAMIGSNAIFNRIAEDGILTDWFRKIHKRYGTTYHVIHFVALMQIIVIIISGGKVYLLGEAYAFGLIWSFVLESLSMIMLRFKAPNIKREFMMPLNFKYRNYNVPVGAILVFMFLFSLASINLITKKTATISGLSFTAIFFLFFHISERFNAKKANIMFEEGHREKLNTTTVATLEEALAELENEKRVLIGVKDPDNLYHLENFLQQVTSDDIDIIVLYAKPTQGAIFGGNALKAPIDENEIFSNVILIAEKYGHTIIPLMVESNDPYYALSQVAHAADADRIIMGVSGSYGANEQLERTVMAWGAVKNQNLDHPVMVQIVWEGREVSYKFTK
ncbi:amino acid transporter [Elusimicrobium posterum]|uniref:APC family permease n=1 Tax=Elusimicrobium posterum TaxID=3116653 RepID=UPI003C788EB9